MRQTGARPANLEAPQNDSSSLVAEGAPYPRGRASDGRVTGLSVSAAVFFVVPIVAAYLPHSITGFVPYLPSNAGGALWGAGKLFGGHQLGPWNGFAVLCGYAVVLTGLAAWRLRRRDA